MRGTGLDYDACRKNMEDLVAWYASNPGERNEATTRLQLLDKIFFDCLGWSRDEQVVLEKEHESEYADYIFSCENLSGVVADMLILEAKREGDTFEFPAGKTRLTYSLNTIQADNPSLKKALRQVAGYCQERGVKIGVTSNGHQLVAFIASRDDGMAPLQGQALVFPSLEFMGNHFLDLWQAFSKPGVQEGRLNHRLVGSASPELPKKLSATFVSYPGIKGRNVFQADMKILAELVIEDVSRSAELEEEFLRECYCQSNALSQYSHLRGRPRTNPYSAPFLLHFSPADRFWVKGAEWMSEPVVYQCQCPACLQPGDLPDKSLHGRMNLFLSRLDEQQRRWYVAVESARLGYGGDRALSRITGMNVETIRRGRRELEGSLQRAALRPGAAARRRAAARSKKSPGRLADQADGPGRGGDRRRPDEPTEVGPQQLASPQPA